MNETNFGRAALNQIGDVPDGFQIFEAGWLEKKPKDFNVMFVRGAVFRESKSGPRKGRKVVEVDGTRKTVYVTRRDIGLFS